MRLYELDDKSLSTKIVTLINKLKSDIDNKNMIPTDWDITKLANYFQKYGVILSDDDLYSMSKVDPLKAVIKPIEGKKVIFRGQEEEPTADSQEKSQETVAGMAKKAMKK